MSEVLNVDDKKDYFLLALSILLTCGLAFIVSMLTRNSPQIYQNLNQAGFAPQHGYLN